jgi:hypothetical protein
MAVRLSALPVGRPLLPGRFLVLISVRGLVDPRAIVRLEGLGQLKSPITSGIEPATFRLHSASTTYATACPEDTVWVYRIYSHPVFGTACKSNNKVNLTEVNQMHITCNLDIHCSNTENPVFISSLPQHLQRLLWNKQRPLPVWKHFPHS